MGAETLLAFSAAAASAGSSIIGGIAANKAAKLEQRQIEEDRKMRKIQAIQEANAVREERSKIMSRNRAIAAASGMSTQGGSFAMLQEKVSADAGRDIDSIRLNALSDDNRFSLQSSQSKLKGKTALVSGFANAGSTLFKAGYKISK